MINLNKILLILAAVIWGSGFPVTKILLDVGVTPYEFLGIRFFITGLLIILYLKLKKIEMKKEEVLLGAISGIILFSAFGLQTVGLVYTTASKNAFITGANVIFVPYITWLLSKEVPKFIYFISSILCFIGIGILSFENDLNINYGDFLTFLCAIAFALQISVVGTKLKNKNPMVVNGVQLFIAGILAVLVNIFLEDMTIFTRAYTLREAMAFLYVIIFNTFVCYSIQTFAQKNVNPTQISLILSTELIFGAILSVFLLGEVLTLKVILGGVLIFISILLSEIKK